MRRCSSPPRKASSPEPEVRAIRRSAAQLSSGPPQSQTNRPPAATPTTTRRSPRVTTMRRLRSATTINAISAAQHVGVPKGSPNAEAPISATAPKSSPASASLPSVVSGTGCSSTSIRRRKSLCSHQYKQPKVTTIEASEGSRKTPSQSARGGICRPNTTRFAGFEMGKTKLAALAIKAHASR